MANEQIPTYLGSIIPYIPETTKGPFFIAQLVFPRFLLSHERYGRFFWGGGLVHVVKMYREIHRINISKPSPYHSLGGGRTNPSEI